MRDRAVRTTLVGEDRSFGKTLQGATEHVGKLHAALSRLGRGVELGAAFDVGRRLAETVFHVAEGTIEAAEQAEKVTRQTEAVLKSTGDAAHVTAGHVADYATRLSNLTGVNRETIQSNSNLLLTFTNVRNEAGKGNDVFDQATKTVLDMSVALGEDGKSAAIQLGKALQDPIRGTVALRRVGVAFTVAQQKQIDTLVKSGHLMAAQKIILAELTKEFGGSAAAIGTPWDKLKNVLHNVQVVVGTALLPTLDRVATLVARALPAALATARGWWDRNRVAVGQLAGVLVASLNPGLTGAKATVGKLSTSLGSLKADLGGVALAAAYLVRAWLITRQQTEILDKAIYDLVIALGYVVRGLGLGIEPNLRRAGDRLIAFGRQGRDVATRDLATLQVQLGRTQDAINRLHGKTVSVGVDGTVHWDKSAALLKQLTGNFTHRLPTFARGGRIMGGSGPTADDVLIRASRGETVVSAEHSRLLAPVFARLGIRGYAAGGLVGPWPQLRDAASDALRYAARDALRAVRVLRTAFGGLGAVGGQLGQWIMAAIRITHVPTSWAGPLGVLVRRESGGNPRAINLADANAARGTPSIGLAQVIGPTFARYHLPGWNDIWNPVANLIAAIRYILARYGSVFRVQQANPNLPPRGYAAGVWNVLSDQLAMIHRGEMVVPAYAAQQVRGGHGGGGGIVVNLNGPVYGDKQALIREIRQGIRAAQRGSGVPADQLLR
jgi:hypothetical protein